MLKQWFRAWEPAPLNLWMTLGAKCNEIVETISRFPITVEFVIRLYVMHAKHISLPVLLPTFTDNAFISVALKTFAALSSPILPAISLIFVGGQYSMKLRMSIRAIWSAVFSASILSRSNEYNTTPSASMGSRLSFCYSTTFSRAILLGFTWLSRLKLIAAYWACSHSILANADSYGECGQHGTSAVFSGATLDHLSIIPQKGAVS